jgi:hypothetical protein
MSMAHAFHGIGASAGPIRTLATGARR